MGPLGGTVDFVARQLANELTNCTTVPKDIGYCSQTRDYICLWLNTGKLELLEQSPGPSVFLQSCATTTYRPEQRLHQDAYFHCFT